MNVEISRITNAMNMRLCSFVMLPPFYAIINVARVCAPEHLDEQDFDYLPSREQVTDCSSNVACFFNAGFTSGSFVWNILHKAPFPRVPDIFYTFSLRYCTMKLRSPHASAIACEPAGLFYVIMMVVEKCIWKISSVPIDEIFLLHRYK